MLTLQDLGIKMAKTVLAELTVIPAAQHLEASRLGIVDPIPAEGKFFEYQKDKTKIEPTKEALLQDMLQNKKSIVAFCCVSLQTDTRMTFDIDHVFPREKITEKQKLLLNYLNNPSNVILAQAFMGENPQNDSLGVAIGKYFKRDMDGQIKGTRWFFDVCYNNFSNLFHLKHYLNRGKSATTPQSWFEQNFQLRLPKFIQDLNAKGGINEGIIMQQIFSATGLDSINLGKFRDKNGKETGSDCVVYLHEGLGFGLGNFIRQWFKANAEVIEVSGEIQVINAKLISMLEEDLGDNEKKEGLEKFLLTINEALKIAENRSKLSRSSSEDSEKAGESRKKVSYKSLLKAFDYMHSVKRIKKQVLANVEAVHQDEVQNDFYDNCIEYWFELPSSGLKIATEYLIQQCALKNQSGVFFTAAEVKELIVEAGKKGDPEERLKALEAEAAERLKTSEAEKAELRRQLAAALERLPLAAPQTLPTTKRPRSPSP